MPWLLAGGAHCVTAQALVWQQRASERESQVSRSQGLRAFGLFFGFQGESD